MRHFVLHAALGVAAAGVLVVPGCKPFQPCGWDEALELGAQYEVELGELNTMESTSALYLTQLDQTRPAATLRHTRQPRHRRSVDG